MKNKFQNSVVRLIYSGPLPRLKSKKRPAMVQLHEVTSDANFIAMFGEVSRDLDPICLSAEDAIKACKAYPEWLRRGHGTLILSKADARRPAVVGNLFVTVLSVNRKGLQIKFRRFHSRILKAKNHFHLITKLAA